MLKTLPPGLRSACTGHLEFESQTGMNWAHPNLSARACDCLRRADLRARGSALDEWLRTPKKPWLSVDVGGRLRKDQQLIDMKLGLTRRTSTDAGERLRMAPRAGFEPATNRLTAERSTTELPGNGRKVGRRAILRNRAPCVKEIGRNPALTSDWRCGG